MKERKTGRMSQAEGGRNTVVMFWKAADSAHVCHQIVTQDNNLNG